MMDRTDGGSGDGGSGQADPCCGQAPEDAEARQCCSVSVHAQPAGPCGVQGGADPERPFVTGWVDTRAGRVPRVSTELTTADRHGNFKMRWGIGRMRCSIEPGLYAVGSPNENSPVLVTANYKLTFDTLRSELSGLDAYIMVLNTGGINVWCAAGKGTFGTAEVVARSRQTRLDRVIGHRNLILPQLSATGVAAHEVRRLSGLKVTYGPVRAADIIPFLKAGMVAAPGMRRVRFNLADRLALAPCDTIQRLRHLLLLVSVFLALSGIDRTGYSLRSLFSAGPRVIINLLMAYLGANILGPALLPWLPGRAFAMKGFVLGLLLFLLSYAVGFGGVNFIEYAGWGFIMAAVSSFILMNFTGSSTFTSLTGVKREMIYAVPFQAVFAILGVVLTVLSRFV